MKKTLPSNNGKLSFSNLEKVFWPDEGYTKGDVINYYNSVYKYIGKYLQDRPESLYRTPNGINQKGFFQKDAGKGAPEYADTYNAWSESNKKYIDYIVCNNKNTLLYLANLGCIEINPWNSRTSNPDNPDYCIIDIDPSEKNTFDQVVETALAIKEILDKAGATGYCKTSGATGMHIYIPLGAKYTYQQGRDFAHIIVNMAHDLLPGFTSLTRSISKRTSSKIYLDYLQNSRGQTIASVYSLRPKPGAPVSTPLNWKEVKKGIDPRDYNITNTIKRLEDMGDLFAGVLQKGIDLNKCINNLEK
jgi:bifunctional non-homologous end joining protein LigD